jgi:Flp pilus assembly protein TadG
MKRRLTAFIASHDGTTALEFAFVAPLLLLFVLGTFEFGRLLWTREALQEAAATGARCMGVLQSSCATGGAYSAAKTTSYVQTLAAQWSVALPAADVALNQNATCGGIAGFSQVSITFAFQTVAPGIIRALSGGLTFSTSACFPNQA